MKIVAVSNLQNLAKSRMAAFSVCNNLRSDKVRETQDSTKYGEIDYYPYSMSNISFTGKFFDKYPKHWLKNLLKLGLPCPCCGKKMPTLDEINTLSAVGAFSASCLAAVNALEPYEDLMKPVEHEVMQILKPLAQKYPGIDLQELIILLSFEYESNLVASQLTVLNKLKAVLPELNQKDCEELTSIIKTAKEFILQKRNAKFKRKTFIKDVEEFLVNVEDKFMRKKIINIAKEIPTSEDSVSAFIMKYKERSPEEIGRRMLILTSATLEHITVKSKDGEVVIWECQYCNNRRSDDAIIEQIEENPNMIDNLKSHIEVIINRANFLKNHGGNVQAQKHYEYSKEIRDEYLKNIRQFRSSAERIEAEALEKLHFDEIPIPDEYKT